MRRIVLGFTAFGVALALSLAGCGSGGDGTNAVSIKALQLAADNTQSAESARFRIEITKETGDVVMQASGVASADGKRGQIVMELPGRGRAEERIVDGVLYLDMGDLSLGASPPNGKRWVELDLSIFGDALPFGETTLSTPTSALQFLEGLSGNVENLGNDTIAGRHATHYRASIDLSQVAESVPGNRPSGTVPVDVWIDDQDRVVKMHVAMGDTGMEVTMEIIEFGVPVEVQAPPPDQVMSFSDLLPGGLRPRDGITA